LNGILGIITLDEGGSLNPPVDIVQVGGMGIFTCDIKGKKEWTFNGGFLPHNVEVTGPEERKIVIKNVVRDNEGIYQCFITTSQNEVYLATGKLHLKGNSLC